MKTGIIKRLVAVFVLCFTSLFVAISVAIIKTGEPVNRDLLFWFVFSALVVWVGVIMVASLVDIVFNLIKYAHYLYLALWSSVLFMLLLIGVVITFKETNGLFFATSIFFMFMNLIAIFIAISVLEMKLPLEAKKSRWSDFVAGGVVTVILMALVFFSGFLIPVNNEVKTNIVDVTMNPYPVAALNDRKKDTSYGLFFSTNSFGKTLDLILIEGPANITSMHITSASLGELSAPARNVLLVADNGTRRSLTLNNVSEQDIEINVGETSRVTLIFSAAVIPGNLQIDEIALYEKKPILE